MGTGWEWESFYQEWDGTAIVFNSGQGLRWDKIFSVVVGQDRSENLLRVTL